MNEEPREQMDENPELTVTEAIEESTPTESIAVEESITEPLEASTPMEPTNPVDPIDRPMEKAPEIISPEPQKPKRGLIIGMIVCLFIAVCCGVAAIIFATSGNQTKDPVSAAVDKLMSQNSPRNVAFGGDIDIAIRDLNSPISKIHIDLSAETSTGSMLNSTSATFTASIRNGGDIKFEFDEVYGANGDLYLKVDGIGSVMSDPLFWQTLSSPDASKCIDGPEDSKCGDTAVINETDCIDDPSGMTDCSTGVIAPTSSNEELMALLGIISAIDGQWFKISVDELTGLASGFTASEGDVSCMVDFMTAAAKGSNSLASIYARNPFVSSTPTTALTSKNSQVYQVNIDEDNLISFIQSSQESSLMTNLYNCLGYENIAVNLDNVTEDLTDLPQIYVEVNDDYDFTRLYLESTSDDDTKLTADIDFTYPTNINISEPTEYQSVTDIMQNLFFSAPVDDVPVIEESVIIDDTIDF
ncbi:hypothetical protein IKF57_02585 [Candidatus Saccharibacteria bacterium]|nr:hypothetical protein [Candidatus Saccharibacteria bacterium]